MGQVAAVEDRARGRTWSDDEVFEGLTMAVLSSGTDWSKVEQVQAELSDLFSGFSLESYAELSDSEIRGRFLPWFKARKAGSLTLARDLVNLIHAARKLLEYGRVHGAAEGYAGTAEREWAVSLRLPGRARRAGGAGGCGVGDAGDPERPRPGVEEHARRSVRLRDLVRCPETRRAARRARGGVLSEWAASDPKPLVLFIDEIDALVGDTLLSVLGQLCTGYRERPRHFPQSVILCGVRNVHDYQIYAASQPGPVHGSSAFNIRVKSLRLGDFGEAEVRALLSQHTEETGQRFAEEARVELWRLSQGQPWLVNALASEVCFEKAGVMDRGVEVSLEAVTQARERLIRRRDTHLDQLGAILQEERVRRVVEPLLAGEESEEPLDLEALRYVRDLGLVARTDPVRIANPIYREVVPRELTYATQAMLSHEPLWYVGADGRLRMDKLMGALQVHFREHSEHWLERFQYREAGPQLLLHAFLHRVVSRGGRIEREYGIGRRRMDLAIIWPVRPYGGAGTAPVGEQRMVVECKVVRRGRGVESVLGEGLAQTVAYMDLWDAEAGHLVLFDRTPGKPGRRRCPAGRSRSRAVR